MDDLAKKIGLNSRQSKFLDKVIDSFKHGYTTLNIRRSIIAHREYSLENNDIIIKVTLT
jgi:hypothetical protein